MKKGRDFSWGRAFFVDPFVKGSTHPKLAFRTAKHHSSYPEDMILYEHSKRREASVHPNNVSTAHTAAQKLSTHRTRAGSFLPLFPPGPKNPVLEIFGGVGGTFTKAPPKIASPRVPALPHTHARNSSRITKARSQTPGLRRMASRQSREVIGNDPRRRITFPRRRTRVITAPTQVRGIKSW